MLLLAGEPAGQRLRARVFRDATGGERRSIEMARDSANGQDEPGAATPGTGSRGHRGRLGRALN